MEKFFKHRKTKIICTIGPSSDAEEILGKMKEKGMDIARLNFSHGTHESHKKIIDIIKKINEENDIPIGIMLDTKGPEIRIGKFREPAFLKDNEKVTITAEEMEYCTSEKICISYKDIDKILKKGSLIYIADGTIELEVEEIKGKDIVCNINIGGEVNTRKNISIPGAIIDLPTLSDQDIKDILFGVDNGIDFIAQSFVKTAEDVTMLKKLLKENNAEHVSAIAKIEAFQGLHNIDNIIKVADGIMVARGDLGVQIPIENIPQVQKNIIKKCNMAGKPVITATQMLESMTKNPKPTRAESTDVANAILDGTDCIMLSGETASGKYPLRVIETMDKIARKTELTLKNRKLHLISEEKEFKPTITDAISKAVCDTAEELSATAILSCTSTGHTARQISRHRPINPIIAITPNEKEYHKLLLIWGVIPILIPYPEDTDELIEKSIEAAKERRLVEEFDLVIITAGIPFNISGNINFMKVEMIQ